MLECSRDTAAHFFFGYGMPALGNPLGHPCLVQLDALEVNDHHDHLVAQRFGLGDKINLGRMGVDRLEAKTRPIAQKLVAQLLGELGGMVSMRLWRVRIRHLGEDIGVDEGQAQRCQIVLVERALACAVPPRPASRAASRYSPVARNRDEYPAAKRPHDADAVLADLLQIARVRIRYLVANRCGGRFPG